MVDEVDSLSISVTHYSQTATMGKQNDTFHGDHNHDHCLNNGNNDDTNGTIPTVELSSTEWDDLKAPYKYSLIVNGLDKKLKYSYLATQLPARWACNGTLNIRELGHGFFLVMFSNSLDYDKVLERVPWSIAGSSIVVHQWVPNFKPSKATITTAAVWVRLLELPIEYYHSSVLKKIGSIIGLRLIKIDAFTERQEKVRFARLCIEVDLNRPLVTEFEFSGLRQPIVYEGIQILCFQCGRVGHLQQDCSYSNSVPSTSFETPSASQNSNFNNSSHPIYGPWLQVPPPWRRYTRQTAKDPGQQQYQVPNRNVATGFECTPSDSRLQAPEQEILPDSTAECKPSKGKSAMTSVNAPHIKMNIEQNNVLMQKQLLQPGEGTSSSAMNKQTSIQAENKPLAMAEDKPLAMAEDKPLAMAEDQPLTLAKFLKPKETATGLMTMPLESKVLPALSICTSSNQLQGTQKHQTNPQPISPTLFSSNVSPSSIGNHPQATQDHGIFPSPPTHLVTVSTSTEHVSYQPTDEVATNPSTYSATLPFNVNQPQPSTPHSPSSVGSIKFYSEVMQQSTIEVYVDSTPVELGELSTKGSPKVLNFNSTTSYIDISVNISRSPVGMANQYGISIIPTSTGPEEGYQYMTGPVPQSVPKKLLSWTCRGAGDSKFMQAMKDLIRIHQPSIVLLYETKISGNVADQVIKDIGFSGSQRVDPMGFYGGLWLLWRKEDVQIGVTSSTSQWIHAKARLLPEAPNWMLHERNANDESCNPMFYYEFDANAEPLSQPWGPSSFYNSEQLHYPPAAEWVHTF